MKRNDIVVIDGVPDWAAQYFMYGDVDGLTEQDVADIKKFEERLDRQGLSLSGPVEGTENEFNACPAFGLACATTDWSALRAVPRGI